MLLFCGEFASYRLLNLSLMVTLYVITTYIVVEFEGQLLSSILLCFHYLEQSCKYNIIDHNTNSTIHNRHFLVSPKYPRPAYQVLLACICPYLKSEKQIYQYASNHTVKVIRHDRGFLFRLSHSIFSCFTQRRLNSICDYAAEPML